LSSECFDLTKQISTEKANADRSARSALNRSSNIFHKRALRQYLHKWHKLLNKQKTQEDRAGFFMKKFRNNLVKQAFDIYVRRVRELRQDDINNDRMEHLIATFNDRKKRGIFNAFLVFKNKFKKARNYWKIVFTKMDMWMRQRAFHRWLKNAHQESEDVLNEEFNTATEELTITNHELGELVEVHQDKVK